MNPLIEGIIVGLTFAVLMGPVFFALIQTSIHRGFQSGVLLAGGILLSDVVVLSLSYLGISQVIGKDPRENFLFAIIGGIILIIFGFVTITRKVVKTGSEKELEISTPQPYIFVGKGFLLNITNPAVWFMWVTVMVSVSSNYGVNNRSIALFAIGTLGTIFFTDVLKSFLANQLKQFLTARVIKWMNRVVGILLIGFGIYLIMNVTFDLKRMIQFYSFAF